MKKNKAAWLMRQRRLDLRDAPDQTCDDVDAMLDQQITRVARRIAELSALQAQLKKLRKSCCAVRTTAECGILNQLADKGL